MPIPGETTPLDTDTLDRFRRIFEDAPTKERRDLFGEFEPEPAPPELPHEKKRREAGAPDFERERDLLRSIGG